MTSQQDNERLTRVTADAPMGAMIRRFWLPAIRAAALEADGTPQRVTICGKNYVAFRATDGRVGLLDELCAHRCASLTLARNEENGLRCIFHGWKFGVDGTVLEIPTEADPARAAAIAKRVPVRHYPVHEAGGIVWVYLGEGLAPKPPCFEFTTLPSDHCDVRIMPTAANWLQNVEVVLDSAHLGFLHRTSIMKALAPAQRNAGIFLKNLAPTIQVEATNYGLREAALRTLPDGTVNTRIREVVAPIHVIIPGEPGAERQHIITVPVDDTHTNQFYITYNPFRPMTRDEIDKSWFDAAPNRDNFGEGVPGREANWGQDRAAMKAGHFSGLTDRHPVCEDIAMVESMGGIVDRTREFLTSIDLTIAVMRRELLKSLDAVARGEPAWGEVDDTVDFRRLRSQVAMLPPGSDWRTLTPFAA